MSLGAVISEARKKANLSQKELAEAIKKEDGTAISPQYLNDIEHDRRNVPSYLIEQLAKVLRVDRDLLYHGAGTLPADIRDQKASPAQLASAYKAFRRALRK